MSLIEITPCDDTRRKVCLHRRGKAGNIDEACTSSDTVLKGCPMLIQNMGCRQGFRGCVSLNKLPVVNVGDKKFLEMIPCEHNVDRITPRKSFNTNNMVFNFADFTPLDDKPTEIGIPPDDDFLDEEEE